MSWTPARRAAAHGLAWSAAVGALSLLGAILLAGLFEVDLSIPFDYQGDGISYQILAKAIEDHGWYLHNPTLGAPGGQQWLDYPFGGNDLQLAGELVLTWFTGSIEAANLWFAAMYPVIGIVTFWVFVQMRVSRSSALVVAVLFVLLPFRWIPGAGHLFLTSYLVVPLACLLLLRVYSGESLFARAGGRRVRGWGTRRTLATVGVSVLIGSWDTYLAAFAVLLLLAAGVVLVIDQRSVRFAVAPVIAALIIVAVQGANLAPTFIQRFEHGANPALAGRARSEAELYGLKVAGLVAPWSEHRLPPLAAAGRRYHLTTDADKTGAPMTLGLTATAGFLFLIAVALGSCLGRSPVRDPRLLAATAATVTALLIGTVGGTSALIAAYVSPNIRVYSRLSIYIAFFALLAIAIGLDHLAPRLRRRGAWAFPAVLAAVLVLGALDQVAPGAETQGAVTRAQWRADAAFVRSAERLLPGDASILNLPYIPYPESAAVFAMQAYDQVRLSLHSSRLKWSAGAMKGSKDDWLAPEASRPLPELLAKARSLGFDAICVDTFGYPDRGKAVIAALTKELGRPIARSADGRSVLFALR
jgi:phosphoglycerol transferase